VQVASLGTNAIISNIAKHRSSSPYLQVLDGLLARSLRARDFDDVDRVNLTEL
jgi:hypothetical protein